MAAKFPNLDEIEHQAIEEGVYKEKLKKQQVELLLLQRELSDSGRSVIIVFEGPDAAGKGGAIKRVVERPDPRLVRVYSIVKPTTEEHQHHYLWRFWTKISPYGQITVFDRSWYGRVLVERVEGFATEAEWQRAYREINELERTLTDDGTIFIKLFLQISKDEQLERFKRREADPLKHWKISDEDWRNRKKWKQHIEAAQEMFERTSPAHAPWTVIGANYKWHARIEAVKTVVSTIKARLKDGGE